MAEFRPHLPPPFNPTINDFASMVTLPIQQAQLFNLAGLDFMKFAHQCIMFDEPQWLSG